MNWVRLEFAPMELAITADALKQQYNNALRYYNTHNAYRWVTLAAYGGSATSVAIPGSIRQIVKVEPSGLPDNVFMNHPMWSLLGFITLDRYTQDLILMQHSFGGYRIYMSNDFRWRFQRSPDPTADATLYIQSVPKGTTHFAITCIREIGEDEDVTEQWTLDWMLGYYKALVMIQEGNIRRQLNMIDAKNDGQSLIDEGIAKTKELQETLRKEGIWMLAMRRG